MSTECDDCWRGEFLYDLYATSSITAQGAIYRVSPRGRSGRYTSLPRSPNHSTAYIRPAGTMQTIGGIECYVATPEGDYAKHKVVLLLTDVFGIPLINNRVRILLRV